MPYARLLLCLAVLAATVALAGPPLLTPTLSVPGLFPQLWAGIFHDVTERMEALTKAGAERFNLKTEPLNEDEEACLRWRETQRALKALEKMKGADLLKQEGPFIVNVETALDFLRWRGHDDSCKRPGPDGQTNRGLLLSPPPTEAQERTLLERVRAEAKALGGRPLTWQEALGIAAAAGGALLAAPALAPL